MSTEDIIFMVAVIVIAALMKILKNSTAINVLGVICGVGASVGAIVSGVMGDFKAIPLGIAGVICALLAYFTKAKVAPDASANPFTLSGVALQIENWPTLVMMVLVVGACVAAALIPQQAPAKSNKTEQRHRAQAAQIDFLRRA